MIAVTTPIALMLVEVFQLAVFFFRLHPTVNGQKNGFEWYAQGIVLRPGRLSSTIEVKRIEGPRFNNKEAAEQHGLELSKAPRWTA